MNNNLNKAKLMKLKINQNKKKKKKNYKIKIIKKVQKFLFIFQDLDRELDNKLRI